MGLPQEDPWSKDRRSKPSVINRVKKTTDWSYLNETGQDFAANDPSQQTVSKTFIRNVNQDRMLGPTKLQDRGKKSEPAANDKEFASVPERGKGRFEKTQQTIREKTEKEARLAKIVIARTKATSINLAALSWAGPMYLFVQLPFAVFGVITLGILGGLDALMSGSGGGWFSRAVGTVVGWVDSVLSWVGADVASIAGALFMISYMLVLGVGILTILALYLQYTLGRLRPLSGEQEGLKRGMLLFAFIGYAVPLVNLFPLVFFWMAAVWFHPK